MTFKNLCFLAACASVISASQANALEIFSDGFETPVVSGFDASSFSPGWTLNETGGTDQLGLRNGLLPYSGVQVAQINANGSAAGSSISRSFSTIIGQDYTISLRYLSYAGVAAFVKADFGLTSSTSPAVLTTDTWNELTFTHTATSLSTLFTITDLTTNTGTTDLLLDEVKITTIPEPTTAGLLGLGAIALLAAQRRRTYLKA